MALCEFSKLVGGPCSASTDYPSNVACVSIGECDSDVKGHLKFCKISSDIAVKNESRLLFARAGKQELSYYVICFCFRIYSIGVCWNEQLTIVDRGHWGLQC